MPGSTCLVTTSPAPRRFTSSCVQWDLRALPTHSARSWRISKRRSSCTACIAICARRSDAVHDSNGGRRDHQLCSVEELIRGHAMNRKLRHATALLTIVILIAGCASENSPNKTAPDFGCKISPQNAQQICRMAAMENKQDPSIAPGSETRTRRASYAVRMSTGEVAANALCEIDIVHNSVVYATLGTGPTSKEAADYLQSQGLCSESN